MFTHSLLFLASIFHSQSLNFPILDSDQTTENPDIEDGEITDDDDDPQTAVPEPDPIVGAPPIQGSALPVFNKPPPNVSDTESLGATSMERFEGEHEKDMGKFPPFPPERNRKNRDGKRNKGERNREDKSHRHMTEAEKSILHLRKREKMFREREKTWDNNKHHPRRDSDPIGRLKCILRLSKKLITEFFRRRLCQKY